MRIKLINVRIAFPQLFEPKQVGGTGKAAFSASFLMEKDDVNFETVMAALKQVAAEKWGNEAMNMLRNLLAGDKLCLHDGDSKPDYEGFSGNWYVSARSYTRPKVVHQNKTAITEADGVIYPGCRVTAVIDIWAQDNKFGKRINAGLGGVQFRADDDAFASGSPVSDDEFEDLAMEGESNAGTNDESIF